MHWMEILKLSGNTSIACTRMDNAIANINREHSTGRLPQEKRIARSFSAGGNMCIVLRIDLYYTARLSNCLSAPQRKSLRNSELMVPCQRATLRCRLSTTLTIRRSFPQGVHSRGYHFPGSQRIHQMRNIAKHVSGLYSPAQYLAEPDTGRPFIRYALPAVGISSSRQ